MQLIEDISRVTRKALESGMPVIDCNPNPKGTCLYASFLLKRTLEQFADCVVKVRGGDGRGDGGILGRDGLWHGHYWVEGTTFTGKPFLADITADQFGFDQVVALPLSQARANYVPGAQDEVDRAVMELDEELNAAKLAEAIKLGDSQLDRGEGITYTPDLLNDITQSAISAMHAVQT